MIDRMDPTQTQRGQTDSSLSRPVRIHPALFYVPLFLTLAAAVFGGTLWARAAITEPRLKGQTFLIWAGAILIALAAESIGNYFSREAEKALLDNQSSGALRLAAYAVGFAVAALSYAHFTDELTDPNTVACTFALFSAMNPILWTVRAKSRHRELERLRGNVDTRTVRLDWGRKMYHPIRSFKVMRHATWIGETNPQSAVNAWEATRSLPAPPAQTEPIRAHIETDSAPEITDSNTDRIQITAGQSTDQETDWETDSQTEAAEQEVTQTVTKTVTQTETTTTVSRQERKMERLRERVALVQTRFPNWQTDRVKYEQIREATGLSGAEPVKLVYAALYRSETEEYAIVRNA